MKVYQFKTGRKRIAKPKPDYKFDLKQTKDPEPGLIQGRQPGSVQEWRVSVALERLHVDYWYQYEIMGGSALRGGQIIDFVCWLPPVPILLYVQGDYWHQDKEKNRLMQARALKYFRNNAVVKEVWETELITIDMAFQTLRLVLYGR